MDLIVNFKLFNVCRQEKIAIFTDILRGNNVRIPYKSPTYFFAVTIKDRGQDTENLNYKELKIKKVFVVFLFQIKNLINIINNYKITKTDLNLNQSIIIKVLVTNF